MKFLAKSALTTGMVAILMTSTAPAMAAVSLDREKTVLTAAGEYNGWRNRRHRHRDRVDGGDILAGIAILAGVAIVADAASKQGRDDRRPAPYPPERYPQDERTGGRGNDVSSAVEVCSWAAERDNAQVEEIRSVTRDGEGWRVEGGLSGGEDDSFVCGATNGEVDFIQFGGREI